MTSNPIAFTSSPAPEPFPGLHEILPESEVKQYPHDIVKSWQSMAEPGGKPSGRAQAVSDCLEAYGGKRTDENSILIPLDFGLSKRYLQADTGVSGGFLIGSQVDQEVADVLRAYSICVMAGAQVKTNLHDYYSIGRELTEVTFQWLHQGDTIPTADSSFGQANLTPHRCAGATSISKELIKFSHVDVQGFVISSLAKGLSTELDRGALNGSGNLGEILGAYNTPGVNTQAWAAAVSWAKLLLFQEQVLTAKGRLNTMAFVAPPPVRTKMMSTQRFSSAGSRTLWDDSEMVCGRPAYCTTNMPAASLLCGDFSSMTIGFFGPSIETIVDKFSLKKQALIEIYCVAYADCAIRYPQLWTKNSDSSLQ